MKIPITAERFTPLPAGCYRVKVVSVRGVQWEPYGWALEWEFEVVEGPYAGCLVRGHTNLHNATGPRQKFGRWYYALTGTRTQLGDAVETDDLIHKTCWAQIEQRVTRRGKPGNTIELIPGRPDAATHSP